MSAFGVPGRHNSLETSVARRQDAAEAGGPADDAASRQLLPGLAAVPGAAADAVAADAERLFQDRKRRLVAEGRRNPLVRVAAFLVAVSRTNVHEGRAPGQVTDSLQCGLVSDLLGMSIDTLQDALVELEHRGLVAPADDGGLRLLDLARLDALSADAPGQTSLSRDELAAAAGAP